MAKEHYELFFLLLRTLNILQPEILPVEIITVRVISEFYQKNIRRTLNQQNNNSRFSAYEIIIIIIIINY
jgi:hypothetical protein